MCTHAHAPFFAEKKKKKKGFLVGNRGRCHISIFGELGHHPTTERQKKDGVLKKPSKGRCWLLGGIFFCMWWLVLSVGRLVVILFFYRLRILYRRRRKRERPHASWRQRLILIWSRLINSLIFSFVRLIMKDPSYLGVFVVIWFALPNKRRFENTFLA